MANAIVRRLFEAFKTFDRAIDTILGRNLPPGNLFAIEYNAANEVQPINFPGQSLKEILNDTILWAVPKKRRTIEKRLSRRFGIPEYHWKPHVPKTNILMCRKCGHDYEADTLCGHCYEVVKKETELMQKVIQDSLGLSPVEQDVVVLYEGERREQLRDDFWKKQRIVELPKKRPEWFSSNLLQPIAQESTFDEQTEKPQDEFLRKDKND